MKQHTTHNKYWQTRHFVRGITAKFDMSECVVFVEVCLYTMHVQNTTKDEDLSEQVVLAETSCE